ncbi:MAG: IS110 family transposase [Phycisphaerales bacterium]|nr:IS110 family transposase [Phycisphaerales bacterium]
MEQGMGTSKPKIGRTKLEVMHPDSAGIDVGGSRHYVAVRSEAAEQPVRDFGCYTCDLHAMADWLQHCGVRIVALESTGVYWIPLYEVLERRGFEVLLVNARHVRGVSGRKSDVLDCQWLQQLLSYGLLKGAFRPHDQMCELRELNRLRTRLLREQGRSVQHMHKALTLMNVQLTNAISDVAGVTGQKIVRAIVEGMRDPEELASYRDARIKASEQEIAASLQGNWRAEHIFALKVALATFDFCAQQLLQCEEQIDRAMQALQRFSNEPAKAKKRSKAKNAPKFDVRERLFKMCGVDLTRINGIDVSTAMTIVSEVGTDMSRFPSDKHFASWLGLCPGTYISGGKSLGSATKHSTNRATQALKQAAAALRTSQSALGAYFRRLCGRMDKAKAVTAAAHKLARLVYAMLTKGEEYTDQGQQYYEERYRERAVRLLQRRANKLGMLVVPATA